MRDVRLDLSAPPPKQRSVNRTALFAFVALAAVIAMTLGVAVGMSRVSASKPRPASAQGLTFWSGGDSMSYYISVAMREALAPQGAVFLQPEPEYQGGSGLLSPDFFDWHAHMQNEVLPLDPRMIVFMVGANDAYAFTPDGYRERVAAMMDTMKGDGRYVVWIGQPNMQEPAYAETIREMNEIFRSEASKRSWVRYVDVWDVSSDAGGNYTQTVVGDSGEELVARDDDGIHLTPQGGVLLAEVVLEEAFRE